MYIKTLRQLLADHDQKASPTLDAVATMVLIVAKDWLKQPPEQIVELKKVKAKLPKLKPGLTQKNRDLLAAFDDETLLRKFLFVPDRMWDEALYDIDASLARLYRVDSDFEGRDPDATPKALQDLAIHYRDGLLVAVASFFPLRRSNLADLMIGTTITRGNQGGRSTSRANWSRTASRSTLTCRTGSAYGWIALSRCIGR